MSFPSSHKPHTSSYTQPNKSGPQLF